MSSAAARAEARKKAILSRGSDRLAKLTSSARPDDSNVFDNGPKLRTVSSTSSFVGEESQMPAPVRHASPEVVLPPPQQQQPPELEQFMQALMNSSGGQGQLPPPPPSEFLQALMRQASPGPQPRASTPTPGKGPEVVQQKSLIQKLLPLLHLAALAILLGYFIIYVEPAVVSVAGRPDSSTPSIFQRWAALLKNRPDQFGVSLVPFFWAFITLQLMLHSLRIFGGMDRPQPPALLAAVLPHLPPPIPTIVTHALKYLQMGSSLLDDLALLIFIMGLCVWLAGFVST